MTSVRQQREKAQVCDCADLMDDPDYNCWERHGLTNRIQPCAACGDDNGLMQLDHIIPLSHDGQHCGLNQQPLCGRCNKRKGDKFWPAPLIGITLRYETLLSETDAAMIEAWANGNEIQMKACQTAYAALLEAKAKEMGSARFGPAPAPARKFGEDCKIKIRRCRPFPAAAGDDAGADADEGEE